VAAWLKILLLLILGGILSTLGDRLGTRVGKARLSIFKLRPRSTAVLITVFTGSIISAISFATMVVFDRDLRVGLFQLDGIREKIVESEKELKKLEQIIKAHLKIIQTFYLLVAFTNLEKTEKHISTKET